MIFDVTWDDESIYSEGYELISPVVNMELNSAGSFEFTIPPHHKFYSYIGVGDVLCHTVKVYEGNPNDPWREEKMIIFEGRPVEISIDFYKRKKVYCEGVLAYFNDTVQKPFEMDIGPSSTLLAFITKVIDQHNEMLDDGITGQQSRKIFLGNVTDVTGTGENSRRVYRKVDWQNTLEVLETMCLETDGGYFFIERREDQYGIERNFLDWKPDMNYAMEYIKPTYYDTVAQEIKFGVNLVDLTQKMQGGEIVTCCIPLGYTDDEGNILTISSVNPTGRVWLESPDLVEKYGRIFKTQEWSDIQSAQVLYEKGMRWLKEEQYRKLTVECDAADLYYIKAGKEYLEPFRIGTFVEVVSEPHGFEVALPILRMSINLDSGVKKITIGYPEHKELTKITKDGA